MSCPPLARTVTRLIIRQYKSIEACDIQLSPLTFLVGRNGAGKSNTLDALSFVADALSNTLEFAVRQRGGIAQVRRKSSSKPTHPAIVLELRLPSGETAKYGFGIAAVKDPQFRVNFEECWIKNPQGMVTAQFCTRDGSLTEWSPKTPAPPVSVDRLYLPSAAGLDAFRPVYDLLTRMVFHNLNPEAMKRPQAPDPGLLLAHDGSNLASVIKRLTTTAENRFERALEYLRAIGVPIRSIEHKLAAGYDTLQIQQERGQDGRPATFDAISLSDGTIRALGILVSLLSAEPAGGFGPSLIGIEEPETALHPAAAGALMDALVEGSESTQLLITCHSPDLLDHSKITAEAIRPVVLEDGRTRIGQLSKTKSDLLVKHLSTAGELLRLDQLVPDPEDLRRQQEVVGTLFEGLG